MSYPGQPQQQVIYQQVVRPPSNGVATTSLVFGIIGAAIGVWAFIPVLGIGSAIVGFPLTLVAIITGHIGYKRADTLGGIGKSSSMTGMILGYVTLAIIALVTLFWTFAMVIGGIGSASSS